MDLIAWYPSLIGDTPAGQIAFLRRSKNNLLTAKRHKALRPVAPIPALPHSTPLRGE